VTVILEMIIGAIAEISVEGAWEKAKRREAVVRVLQRAGLKPDDPPSDFDGVYAYTLVEYGVGKPKPILDFFRHSFVRDAFRQSFEQRDPSVLHDEAGNLIEWHTVGEQLRVMDVDPRREFARFTAVFSEIVDRTRTPVDVKRDQKLDDIYGDLHQTTGEILDRLDKLDALEQIRAELVQLAQSHQSRQFILAPTGGRLKVFISSKMTELRDVREIVCDALQRQGIEAFVYEESAGASPETVVTTSLREVEAADLYVGLFWRKYGEVTVEEYRHARKSGKPCFVYIRDRGIDRDPELQAFLEAEVYDLVRGLTYDYFDKALQLGNAIACDIMAWLVRRYREFSAQTEVAEVSREEIERLKAEVARLEAISREPLAQGDAADNLARQLREWFSAINYGLEQDVARNGAYAELVINVPRRRRGYDRVLVRALDGEIEVSHVRDLHQGAAGKSFDEGWLVCERRISQAARQEADAHNHLFVYTFDELLDEEVNWDRYFVWLENEVKDREVDVYYVPLRCTVDDLSPEGQRLATSRYGNLDEYIDRWRQDPSKEHISILGEFGTGKTWFTLHYAYQLMEEYREAKRRGLKRPRIPLVIQLRNYARGFKDVGALLSEFVFREHEIGLPSYRAFEQLNRMGRLLLIFDGFDEMAARVDRQKVVNNFWELAKVAVPDSKAMLTCRTEHFHYAQQEREILHGKLRASTSAIVLQAPKFEVVHLERFNENQISEVLGRRAGTQTVEAIMGRPELVDMASRPVLIELLLEALEDIEVGKPVDIAHVFYYAVVRKMENDIRDERTFTSLADKLYFLCELSWEMLSTERMSLSYRQFPDRIRMYFGPKVGDLEEDHWHHDLLGQTMLVRDGEGNYSPAHRSLLEFFVSYKFAAELGVLLPEFAEAAQQQTDLRTDRAAEMYTWSEYFQRRRDDAGRIVPIPPLAGFERELVEKLDETVGRYRLSTAVLDLMKDMVKTDVLWQKLEEMRSDRIGSESCLGGNCLTLLVWAGEDMQGRSLDNLNLQGAILAQVDMTGSDFSGSDLRGSLVSDVILRDVSFVETQLGGAVFEDRGRIKNLHSLSEQHEHLLVAREGLFSVIGTETGRPQKSFPQRDFSFVFCYDDGRGLVTGNRRDGSVGVWDIETGSYVRHSARTSSLPVYIAASPTEDILGVMRRSGRIQLLDWNSLETRTSWKPYRVGEVLCWSQDGRKLITQGIGDNGRIVSVWNSADNALLYTLDVSTNRLARGYPDEYILLTDQDNGKLEIYGIDDGELAHRHSWNQPVAWIALSRPKPILCFAYDTWIILKGLLSEETLLTMESVRVKTHNIWAFPEDNDLRIIVDHGGWLNTWLVDLDELRCEEKQRIVHETGGATRDIVFDLQENLLICGNEDGRVRLWNYQESTLLRAIEVGTDCTGAQIEDATGLEPHTVEWLKRRGAVGTPGEAVDVYASGYHSVSATVDSVSTMTHPGAAITK
jgi:predicted NACHT family NTPase